jgi:conjugative relaxase-like TrwC/TraI family protein
LLRLAKLTDAEYVLRQVAGGLEDYYLGSGEAPGVWSGRLADQLGLVGVVGADDLRSLIDRCHPLSGEALGDGPGRRPTVRAIDATFSAPKSVSVLWAFAGSEVASVVSIAHVEAVEAALGFVEAHAAVTRRQDRGVRIRAATSGWAAATFVHRTSRAGDPQLHTHAVIANVVCRDDGRWVSLDASALYGWAKAAGSVYQEELRRRLSERLGVGWGPDRNGCREMTGISETQLRAFSKRTAQIEARLAANGAVLGDAKARMAADEAASVATRPAKDRNLTPEHLRARWDAEAAEVDLPRGEALLRAVRKDGTPPRGITRVQLRELFDRLVDPEVGLCAHDSRFGEPQVVAAVAAWGAGRLSVSDVEAITWRFLRSDLVVRLVGGDLTGRAGSRWSTVEHLRVEGSVLSCLAGLRRREVNGLGSAVVAGAVAAATGLGDDQAAAVRLLCAPGPALRALVSPAGYGKTTTLAAAVDAARRAGLPVLVVSTTNQAVEQLRQAGIPAVTVARFALTGAELEPGTVVVVDEFSQLPTREARTVLSAATGCEDSMVWLVGDPLQAQPVGAGGLAAWVAAQARDGRIPVAELTVNRRQAHPVEQEALTSLRDGRVTDSQELRDDAGWEHHFDNRDNALAAMAAAVLADIDIHGPDSVAALAVSHNDCEALADRIRADLADNGVLAGPVMQGPGWSGPREYQAGDRILLHAHATLADGSRLTNGTVATVTAVDNTALTVATDGRADPVVLPAGFVTAMRPDGRPQVSHAWARTIDGVQGGTWDQAHLLATPALDRYRGYVGQSRSIQPTHTWNTTPKAVDDPADHGGRLVQTYSTPAEQIAAALARAQPKTFAALDDPYRHERRVRAEQDSHWARLDERPPDVSEQIQRAEERVTAREADMRDAHARVAHWQEQSERTAGIRGFSRGRRQQHHSAEHQRDAQTVAVERAAERLEDARSEHQQLLDRQAERAAFDRDNRWRHDRIDTLEARLKLYWAETVLDAARDGHPTAYGKQRLKEARRTIVEQIETLGERTPSDEQQPEAAGMIGDPLRALTDIDRAIRQGADRPDLNLTEPPKARQQRRGMDPGQIHYQHTLYQQLQETAAPSIGIEIGL